MPVSSKMMTKSMILYNSPEEKSSGERGMLKQAQSKNRYFSEAWEKQKYKLQPFSAGEKHEKSYFRATLLWELSAPKGFVWSNCIGCKLVFGTLAKTWGLSIVLKAAGRRRIEEREL